VFAVFDDDFAIHQYVFDSFRVAVGVLVGGLVDDALGIHDYDVGPHVLSDEPAVPQLQLLGGE